MLGGSICLYLHWKVAAKGFIFELAFERLADCSGKFTFVAFADVFVGICILFSSFEKMVLKK